MTDEAAMLRCPICGESRSDLPSHLVDDHTPETRLAALITQPQRSADGLPMTGETVTNAEAQQAVNRGATDAEREVLRRFLSGEVVPPHTDFESALWGACTAMLMLRPVDRSAKRGRNLAEPGRTPRDEDREALRGLVDVIAGRVEHVYAGGCPEPGDPLDVDGAFDENCSACRATERAIRALASRPQAAPSVSREQVASAERRALGRHDGGRLYREVLAEELGLVVRDGD